MAETLLYYKKNDGYGFHEDNPGSCNSGEKTRRKYRSTPPYATKILLTKLDCFLYPATTLMPPGIAN